MPQRPVSRSSLAVCVLAGSLVAGAAVAHTMVRTTSVAEGARLETAPPAITVQFEHPAIVGAVRLTTATGETVPLAWTPPRAAAVTMTVPLPRLDPDRYRLAWRVIAQDGHVMAGALNFTISGPAARPATSRTP